MQLSDDKTMSEVTMSKEQVDQLGNELHSVKSDVSHIKDSQRKMEESQRQTDMRMDAGFKEITQAMTQIATQSETLSAHTRMIESNQNAISRVNEQISKQKDDLYEYKLDQAKKNGENKAEAKVIATKVAGIIALITIVGGVLARNLLG